MRPQAAGSRQVRGRRVSVWSETDLPTNLRPLANVTRTDEYPIEHRDSVTSLFGMNKAGAESIICTGSEDSTVRIWKNKAVAGVLHNVMPVRAIAGCDVGLCVAGCSNEINVYDLETEARKDTITASSLSVNALAAGGGMIVAAEGKVAALYDGTNLTKVAELSEHKSAIKAVCASSKFIFTGGNEKTVKVWDVRKLSQAVVTLKDHKGWVISLAQRGRFLFSGSKDCTVKVWSLEKLACQASLEAHRDDVESITIGCGSVFTGSADAVINV